MRTKFMGMVYNFSNINTIYDKLVIRKDTGSGQMAPLENHYTTSFEVLFTGDLYTKIMYDYFECNELELDDRKKIYM